MVLAAQTRIPTTHICLWGRRSESVQEAQNLGINAVTTNLAEAVEGAEMIILATPVGAMVEILDQVQSFTDLKGIVITDVGSVKLTPRDALEQIVRDAGAIYIGSHPMAGSEQAGIQAARESLFVDAACVMTNDFQHPEQYVTALEEFWQALGCRCYLTTSEKHDQVIARISHFPHLLASIGALVGLQHEDDAMFAGNGMRDTTRVASGHPGMWAEILLRNREALIGPIKEANQYLLDVLALLEQSNEEELRQLLDNAKQLRDQL